MTRMCPSPIDIGTRTVYYVVMTKTDTNKTETKTEIRNLNGRKVWVRYSPARGIAGMTTEILGPVE